MVQKTYSSDTNFTVPAGCDSIDIICHGEDGGAGGGTGGGTGKTVQGQLTTSPGDYLFINCASGGDGGNSNAGSGGDAGVVFKNGDTRDDTVIAGGGGGGTGSGDDSSISTTQSSFGAGGDENEDGSGASASEEYASTSADGGSVNGSSGTSGGNGGSKYVSSNGNWAEAYGGGGGAGMDAGGGGEATGDVVHLNNFEDEAVAAAGGGAGGTATTRGVSSTSVSASLSNGQVYFEFTSTITWDNPGLTAVEAGIDVDLSWNSTTLPTGQYEIKRDGTVIDTVPNSTTSYTDTDVPEGTYDYTVVATNDYDSTASNTVTMTQDRSFGQVLKNGSLASNHRIFADVNGTNKEIVAVKYRQNGTLNDIQ